MQWRIPLFEPDFGPDELDAVQRPVLQRWLTMGETTARLEREFAIRCGVKHAVAVNSGTAALHLAAAASGIGPGDEVVCPTLTFVATANAIRYVGATPVFCDSAGEHNLNAGADQIEERITQRTRALMVVHYAGFPVNLPEVLALAARHNLIVIEDCAHALLSMINGRTCGSWGLAGAFSFFSNKNVTCGEGGMVTTNDDDVAQLVRRMRSHGMTSLTLDRHQGRAFDYDVLTLGYNYRLDEIRSALALAQLSRLEGFLRERARVRATYCACLADTEITVPHFDWDALARPGDAVGHHIMPVLLPPGCDRRKVADYLKEQGIQCSVHYKPVHTLLAYASTFGNKNRPVRTEELAERELTLPMYPTLSGEHIVVVCSALMKAVALAHVCARNAHS